MAGWHESNKNDMGSFALILTVGNSEVILHSRQYESRAAANGGIASVMTDGASTTVTDLDLERERQSLEPTQDPATSSGRFGSSWAQAIASHALSFPQ